ncbi:MAG TPA: hypothetical protein VJ724_15325 [Tahibacter sp.]|nr:hypothetical protein [Tahibacter sp.]
MAGKKPRAAPANKPTFEEAVRAAPRAVGDALRNGKGALKADHARKVTCNDERRFTASLDLDAALQRTPEHAQANRWDYGIGLAGADGAHKAIWIEVHSAETSEVSVVLRKLAWLRTFLAQHCEQLWAMTSKAADDPAFFWVASGRVNIPKHMPQRRALAQAGLDMPKSQLHLS